MGSSRLLRKNTDSVVKDKCDFQNPAPLLGLYERVSYLAFISLGFLNSKTEITTTILYNWKGSEQNRLMQHWPSTEHILGTHWVMPDGSKINIPSISIKRIIF